MVFIMDRKRISTKRVATMATLCKNENLISLMGSGIFAVFEASVLFLIAHTYTQNTLGEWIIFYSGLTLLDKMIFGMGSFSLVKFLSESIDSSEKEKLIGSSWFIQISITCLLFIVAYTLLFLGNISQGQQGLYLLLAFSPILIFIKLPVNQSLAILQSQNKFSDILILRFVGMGIFVLFLIINRWLKLDIFYIVVAYGFSLAINTVVCFYNGWSGITHLFHFKKNQIKKLITYGKYSMGTYVGFNILREADAIIIAFLMTKADAALFVIPLRLIDILNVPLMGIVAVIVPKISKASSDGNNDLARNIYYQYAGALTYLFIPFIGALYFFAPYLIGLLGGVQYLNNTTALYIFYTLLLYGLFLPIDSITGTTLDSINKPKLNFIKVLSMVLINIIGDILAIKLFNSMIAVAVVTNLNLLSGLIMGLIMLKKELKIRVSSIFSCGFTMIKELLSMAKSSI